MLCAKLTIFAGGMIFFTIHYLVLRGFYAVERNRTVFFIQVAVATTNIVAAVVLVHQVTSRHAAAALTAAYGLSYLVGALVSFTVLRRLIGGPSLGSLIPFALRLLVVAGVATGWSATFHAALLTYDRSPGLIATLIQLVAVGTVQICVAVLTAKYIGLTELTSVMSQLGRRVRLTRG